RRVRNIARLQFTSGTRIIETMQEALQGLRMVKAFSLEDEMQRRLDGSVAAVERDSNKMARVSNRSGPLMETLGGFAVALTMSFVAQPGKLTALVGPSGGGKSTVLDLILRFYTVDTGRILIDEQDIATVSRGSLRQQIAYVGQVVQLFRGSIRDNIALGRIGV